MSWPLKDGEVNRITSLFHLTTLLITGTAMVQTGWFRIKGKQCIPHLGLAPFFGFAEYGSQSVPQSVINHHMQFGQLNTVMDPSVTISYLYSGNEEVPCVSPRLVNMMRVIIFLCFDIIIFCIIGIVLNVWNFKNEHAKTIQKNGIMSIMTFVTVIMIIGVSFYVTLIIEQENNLENNIRDVVVTYEFGFYVIVAAGALSIMNAATSLLFANISDMTIIVRRPLIDDWDGMDSFNIEPSPNIQRAVIRNSASFPAPSRNRPRPPTTLHPRPQVVAPGNDLVMTPPPPPYTP